MEVKTNPWDLYDRLIEGIPEGIGVRDFCIGADWCCVEAECGAGLSHLVRGGARGAFDSDPRSLDLRSLAELTKSWSFQEATLGVAALNAWYNRLEALDALGVSIEGRGDDEGRPANPFDSLKDDYAGKKVTVVGHFPNVEAMAETCELTVLERAVNSPLDTPDPACEYLIPEQDFLFVTGITITNKTVVRLLELAQGVRTIMTGPSTIVADPLIEAGVSVFAGSCVTDAEAAMFAVKGGSKELWRDGIKRFYWEP